jgi:hypothetical protein
VSELRRAAGPDRSLLPAPQRFPELTQDSATSLELLRAGTLEILGRLTDASNATFLCRVLDAGVDDGRDAGNQAGNDPAPDEMKAVYKPIRGERPLDDFPRATLSNREVAAFALSEATGWNVVPPTVMRDGPLGPGMVQLWIDVDTEADVLQMIVGGDERLRRIAIFDILANNADRKGGHLLPTPEGHIYGVDHGICFAVDPKLRTVLWGWRGSDLMPEELEIVRDVCNALEGSLATQLAELLAPGEVRATQRRAEELIRDGRFPQPDPNRPALPWPPF